MTFKMAAIDTVFETYSPSRRKLCDNKYLNLCLLVSTITLTFAGTLYGVPQTFMMALAWWCTSILARTSNQLFLPCKTLGIVCTVPDDNLVRDHLMN